MKKGVIPRIFSRQAGAAIGGAVGSGVAASSVTVLGSSTLGSAALGFGLVSAPIAPIIIGVAVGGLIGTYAWRLFMAPPTP